MPRPTRPLRFAVPAALLAIALALWSAPAPSPHAAAVAEAPAPATARTIRSAAAERAAVERADSPAAAPTAAPRIAVESLGDGPAERLVIRGEVLVPAPAAEVDRLVAALDRAGFVVRAYAPGIGALRVGLPGGMSVADGLARVAAVPGAHPVPNALAWAIDARAASIDGPADPQPPWVPDPADWQAAAAAVANEASPAALTRAAEVAARAIGLPIVAVVDTGVGYRSAVLPRGPFVRVSGFQMIDIAPGWDFVHGDELPLDDNMHGSHVASVALAGAAYGARIMPIKVLDWQALGSEFDVARGIDYAIDHGAHVINLSLTFGPGYVPSAIMLGAVDRALAEGVVIVAGSGNAGASSVAHPAAFEGVIAVGALDEREAVASYSNGGGALDLVALGGGLPEASAGVAADSFTRYQPTRIGRQMMSGTSVASARVAGQIATMLTTVGLDSGAEVTEAVLATPQPLTEAAFDSASGLGALDPEHASRVIIGDRGAPPKPGETGMDRPAAYPMVFIEDLGQGAVRGVGLIEVMGTNGRPLVRTTVHGDWLGSAPGSARCTTDDFGRCAVETAAIEPGAESPVFGLIVHRIVAPGDSPRRVRPGSRMDADGAVALNDAMTSLTLLMPAGTYAKGDLGILAETDPVTGAPLYCLGFECPTALPPGGRPDDVFEITYSPLMTITRLAGGLAGPDSVFAGRTLAETFTVRRLGRAFEGSGLTVAFDAAFRDALVAHLGAAHVFEDDAGLHLASDGPADTLMWVNDVAEAQLAGGVGMVISGMYTGPGMQAPPVAVWAVERFYRPLEPHNAGGVGMVISGMMVGVMDTQTFWDINEMQFEHDWHGFGIGMVISGMSPPPVFQLPYFQPPPQVGGGFGGGWDPNWP